MAQRAQQQTSITQQQKRGQPKRTDLIFHLFKTGKLVSALLKDKRVHVLRKAAYLGILGLILLLPLAPELVGQFFTVVIPVLLPGEVIELPVDGTIDWVTFAVATFSLLKLFPKDIVGEHYDRLFRR